MESPSMLAPTVGVVSPPSSLSIVHRFHILLKAHYFLFFSAFGVLYPVLNITLRSRGLSTTELSYINIIIPFLVFFTNPIMGFLADRSRRYLFTFNFILGSATILYVIMFMLPSVKSRNMQGDILYDIKLGRVLDFCASQEAATKCASRSECGCYYQANCSLPFVVDQTNNNQIQRVLFPFTMNTKDINKDRNNVSKPAICGIEYRVPIDQAIKEYTQNHSSDPFRYIDTSSRLAVCEITCSIAHYCHGPRYPQQMRYILFYAVLFIIGTTLFSNAIPLGASLGFASLDRPDIFGQQRVFGTIGFGISAFLASRLYEFFQAEFVYIIMFSIIAIICILVTSFIRIQPSKQKRSVSIDEIQDMNDLSLEKKTEKKKKKSQFELSALLPLLKKIDVIVFLSLTFIWGMSYAVLDPYLYLYIDEIAPCQSRSIVGWMSLVAALAEVIALYLAGRVLKFLGTNFSSILILLAFAVRFGGYYYIRQPYYLIAMETMHFFNFGILYVLIAQKADSIAPPGLSGTLQGVAYGVSFGLGRGVGLLASSLIYTLLEQRSLFLYFAVFNLIVAIIYALYFIINKQRSSKLNEKNNSMNDAPKMIIESDTKLNEEPLLMSSSKNKSDKRIIEQKKRKFFFINL